ncbi:ANTAR domain-containing protein [Amycolatopsis acidiphila]|uniref:ANTAR domain-containing protein n=1 Tax=Amycolatopsis acidiphila TaxID=715473 RepID=A0A558A898_9PSEU|nr:ANTAR domain-containing protein [Amycolatopsis acidiphila]TVT20485.1 ANTAR domain-containing protein [Amycolatopsis acidiphila]UIJ57010.1 ANTAR domain-containing protein [Amycolatopsis acidiphila]GHG53854.1 hypothetical protein GCM10017788_02940 [Amycolatopsis acidiphila]
MDRGQLGPLARELAGLTRALLGAATVAEALAHVSAATERLIPEADLVSVSLQDEDGRLHTPVGDPPSLAEELDRLQTEFGEGPCFDAALPAGPARVSSADLAHEPAWPKFGPAAAAHGFSSVLSTALLPDPEDLGTNRGALNVYSKGRIGPEAPDTAMLLAAHAALALAHTRAVTYAELERTHLRRAIDSRDVIGQAKGILMARRGVSAEEAFDILRRTSQDLNVKLADLARTLATRHAELDLPGE